MVSSLSNLLDNITTEGIHKIQYRDCDIFLEYESVSSKIDEELKKKVI